MFRKLIITGMAATAVALAGCGGGGSSSGSNSGPSAQPAAVAGPLDTVQSTSANSIYAPLESATAGTPLAGVLSCSNTAVNGNLLDTGDALINGLQNPTSLSTVTPAQVQAELAALAQNLSGLLTSLAGTGSCTSTGGTGTVPTANPLAGTPLAPLGDALLPVLQQFQQQLGSAGGGTPSLATLAAMFAQLNTAYQSGLAQLPTSATSAPIVGGILTSTGTTISDESTLLNAAAANDPTAFNAAAQTFVYDYLVNTLTMVVPVDYIESQSGQSGTISNPIKQAATQAAAAFAQALASYSPQLLNSLNSSQISPVFSPVNSQVLPSILAPITNQLSGVSGSTGTGGSLTGTPLDSFLTPLITALNGLNGSTSSSGTCVFASYPLLSTLCTVVP